MSATLSVLKACTGGYVGNGHVHPALLDAAREAVAEAKARGTILDAYVARCGDDIGIIALHAEPPGSPRIRAVAHESFTAAAEAAARLAQHGAAHPNGGPQLEVAEVAFRPRPSEPIVCFLSDKAGPAAWNMHLYRIFGDPFNSPSLVDDPLLFDGFSYAVREQESGAEIRFDLPEGLHGLLRCVGSPGWVIREVVCRTTGTTAAVASSGPDPILVVRCEDGLPSVGEALEAFAFPYAVRGWLGGTHVGPLMPVSVNDESASRFDGPPRAIGLGFQVAADRLVGPRDLLGDRAFDDVRRRALEAADYLRRHGPFAPHRLAATAPAKVRG